MQITQAILNEFSTVQEDNNCWKIFQQETFVTRVNCLLSCEPRVKREKKKED